MGTMDKFHWVQLGVSKSPEKGKEIDLGDDVRKEMRNRKMSLKIILGVDMVM